MLTRADRTDRCRTPSFSYSARPDSLLSNPPIRAGSRPRAPAALSRTGWPCGASCAAGCGPPARSAPMPPRESAPGPGDHQSPVVVANGRSRARRPIFSPAARRASRVQGGEGPAPGPHRLVLPHSSTPSPGPPSPPISSLITPSLSAPSPPPPASPRRKQPCRPPTPRSPDRPCRPTDPPAQPRRHRRDRRRDGPGDRAAGRQPRSRPPLCPFSDLPSFGAPALEYLAEEHAARADCSFAS